MKKFLIGLLILPLALVSLLFTDLNVHAMADFEAIQLVNNTQSEYPLDWDTGQHFSLWHDHIVGTRAYVHHSMLILNADVGLADASNVVGTVKTDPATHIFKLGNTNDTINEIRKYSQFGDNYQFNTIGNPDMTTFNRFVIEIVDGDQTITAYASDTPVIQLSGPGQYAYSHIDPMGVQVGTDVIGIQILELDQSIDADFPISAGPTMKHMYVLEPGINYKMYWTTGTTIPGAAVEDLPETTGSPFSQTGQIGTVEIEVNELTHEVTRTIHYDTDSYVMDKIVLDRIDFLENVTKAYYYTDNEQKFITFSYEDNEPVFLHDRFLSRKWADSAVWNLSTGKIQTVNLVTAFSHIYSDKDDFLYNLIYIPDIIIEDILQVSLTFKYQYYYHFTGKGEWQYETKIIEKEDRIEVMPTWEKKLFSWVPFILGNYQYFLALNFDFRIGFTLPYLISDLLFNKNSLYKVTIDTYLQAITPYTPSQEMAQELTSEWSIKTGKDITLDFTNNNMYKMVLGQYSKFGSKLVLVDPLGNDPLTGYTEIVFVTDGEVRHLEQSQIFTIGTVDKNNDPDNYPDTKPWWEYVLDFLANIGKWGSLILFIVIGGLTANIVVTLFKNIFGKKVNKNRAIIALSWIGLWILLWSILI